MDVHSDDTNINVDDHSVEYKGFDIVFEQPFLGKYPIINKTNGIKNLRCFPCCTAPFHSKQGFCGQSVNIRLFFYRYVTFIHTFINSCIHTCKHKLIYTYIHKHKHSYIRQLSFIIYFAYILCFHGFIQSYTFICYLIYSYIISSINIHYHENIFSPLTSDLVV